MKKALLALVPIIFLFSCVDYSEEFSSQTLQGKWLNKISNDYESMDNVLVFQTNGSYEAFFIRTENSEGFAPGIVGYYKGNYAVTDDKLVLSDRKYYDPEDFENPPTEASDMIEQANFPMPNQSAELSFEENKTVMVLVFECIDTFGGFAAMCMEPEPTYYDKVME